MNIISNLRPKVRSTRENVRRMKYASYYKHLSINENIVIYDAYFSRGILGNPYAIFKTLKSAPDFPNLIHIFAIEDFKGNAPVLADYKNDKNVIFVKRHSKAYIKYLATAKYIVTNVSMPFYYIKKPGQICVNTWHGIPIKKLGYDLSDANVTITNVLRSMLSADFLVSPCPFLTEIYLDKYKLRGLYQGKIIEEGYPRCDLAFTSTRQEAIAKLRSFGLKIDDSKQIILYAPTWKGSNYYKPDINTDEYFEFKSFLESKIDTDKYQILLKPHQVVYNSLKDKAEFKGLLVPAYMDANELMAATDILVSDYSSIFFDFAATRKPIIFYIPDLEEYKDYHGLYFETENLPGPASASLLDIAEYINNLEKYVLLYKEKYDAVVSRFCSKEDGHSSDRLIDIVFRGKSQYSKSPEHFDGNIVSGEDAHGVLAYKIIDCKDFITKKRLLLYTGGMQLNGISTSAINLVSKLDFDKYDVTVFSGNLRNYSNKDLMLTFDNRARVFSRISSMPATFVERIRYNLLRIFGFNGSIMDKIYPKKMYDREFKRCFGNADFDVVIDFSGYGSFYSILMLSAKGAKKLIWQHNDLSLDRQKIVAGKHPHKRELSIVFSAYKYYDKIVACSKATMEINLQKIGYNELSDKCAYVENIANLDRVIKCAQESYNDKELAKRSFECLRDKSVTCFVTIGRLSPEKNHSSLISAFDKFNTRHPDSRLFIIGDGVLKSKLQQQIDSLGINSRGDHKNIFLTGKLDNPFKLMKECDCFVLPSLYEGQPITILEARVLKLPIIVANFASVSSSLRDNGQLLCQCDTDSIENALEAFLKGKVPTCDFDAVGYNENALQQFYNVIQ